MVIVSFLLLIRKKKFHLLLHRTKAPGQLIGNTSSFDSESHTLDYLVKGEFKTLPIRIL
jgi:hypothetical protein